MRMIDCWRRRDCCFLPSKWPDGNNMSRIAGHVAVAVDGGNIAAEGDECWCVASFVVAG